jgi:hypothetical protein
MRPLDPIKLPVVAEGEEVAPVTQVIISKELDCTVQGAPSIVTEMLDDSYPRPLIVMV